MLNIKQRLTKFALAFSLALAVFGLGFPAAAAAAAPAPQGVDCQLQAKFCPATGALTFDCIGDCQPFPGICVKVTITAGTLELINCECRGPNPDVPARQSDCSLYVLRDNATGAILSSGCVNNGCAGVCTYSGGTDSQGCLVIRCAC